MQRGRIFSNPTSDWTQQRTAAGNSGGSPGLTVSPESNALNTRERKSGNTLAIQTECRIQWRALLYLAVIVPCAIAAPPPGCDTAFPPMAQPPACTPILETVFIPATAGATVGRVTSISWDGSIKVQPAVTVLLKVRAPSPTTLNVLVNGQQLTQVPIGGIPPQPDDAGYYTADPEGLPGPQTAWLFWTITIKLPKEFRFTSGNVNVPAFTITLRDLSLDPSLTGNLKQAPDLNLPIAAYTFNQCPPVCTAPPPAPSQVFLRGENSKDDTSWPNMPRAALGIVAQDVTLAGWIKPGDPQRGDFPFSPPRSEDFHYGLLLDPDFIQRTYPAGVNPLLNAIMPGQPESQACWTVNPGYGCPCLLPGCAAKIPLTGGSAPDAGTFLLPGEDDLEVELNAWHKSARGPAPPGYQEDADKTTYSDNAWGFNTSTGTVLPASASHSLQSGDYVIVTGTLWQDIPHLVSDHNPTRSCFDSVLAGHGGWLEIHPVDVVRYVQPAPKLRKHPEVVGLCSPAGSAYYGNQLTPDDAPTSYSVLRYAELPDPRFTDPKATLTRDFIMDACDPSKLNVSISAIHPGGTAYYKSVILVWWEETNTIQPKMCPAVSFSGLTGSGSARSVSFKVTDRQTGAAIAGATITVNGKTATTDASGSGQITYAECATGGNEIPCQASVAAAGYVTGKYVTPVLPVCSAGQHCCELNNGGCTVCVPNSRACYACPAGQECCQKGDNGLCAVCAAPGKCPSPR